jgi:Protein of unknown function (DUF998)
MLKEIKILTVLIVLIQASYGQPKLPIIKANSKAVTIKFGENYINGWTLQPEVKPDIFSIGSPLKVKKIGFITDIDSIFFDVHPGHKYDFIILLNNKEACYTQIAILSDPVFLNKYVRIGIFSLLSIIAYIAYRKRKLMETNPLLCLGILTPLLFWISTIGGGFIHGNYNHLSNVISELGAIGTKSEIFMSISEMLLSVMGIFFFIGFYRASKEIGISVVPAITTLSFSASIFWASMFPLGHELHPALGPIPLLMNLGALSAVILWRGEKQFFPIRLLSLIGFFVMSLIALRFIPSLRGNFEGFIQRLYYLGWSVWFVSLSFCLIILIKSKRQDVYNNTNKPKDKNVLK